MSNRLITVDKCPSVQPIGIGQIWRHLFAKCVPATACSEATEAVGADQLYIGVSACIEGAIHAMGEEFSIHGDDEDWRFLLVAATNEFNKEDLTLILWNIHHQWPSDACFTFNCYSTTHFLNIVHGSKGSS